MVFLYFYHSKKQYIMAHEITCINKIRSDKNSDTFEYRDMYNDVKTISFPKIWDMSEDEVEESLTVDRNIRDGSH